MPALRRPAGKPPSVAARGPDSEVFGGLCRRRRKLWLSFAPPLPWRKNAVANHRASRPRGGGKLDDLAAHDGTAFPVDWILDAVIRGVLCTRVAWPWEGLLMVGVRAGAEVDASPRLDFLVSLIYEIIN
jgi:hypothetical protein